VNTHAAPTAVLPTALSKPTEDGGVPVAGQRDRPALKCPADCAAADQLPALLAPYPVRAREHPSGADTASVEGPADEGGVPVAGKRDRIALI
jgi:hypothetical protein